MGAIPVNKIEYVNLNQCPLCNSLKIDSWDRLNNICTCKDCGFIFDNPRPSFFEISNFYSQPMQYDSWLADLPERERLWLRRLKKIKKHSKNGVLLDVGAGIGQFLASAKPYFSECKGTEISDTAIAIAQKKFNIHLYKGRIEEINFAQTFDSVTLFHVLEHVENPKKTLLTVSKLLNKGGLVYIAVPNDINSIKQRIRRIIKKIFKNFYPDIGISSLKKIKLDKNQYEIHLSHFKPNVLIEFLEAHDFYIEEESLDPYFVNKGIRLALNEIYYAINLIIFKIIRINFYDTIWITAKKL